MKGLKRSAQIVQPSAHTSTMIPIPAADTTATTDESATAGNTLTRIRIDLLAILFRPRYRGRTKQPNFMADKSIEEKVKDIIVEQLGVNPEQVTPQASFIEDLGADSLDIVELVMAFEEEFSVEVPDEDAEKLQTVGDVIKYIQERAKPKE